MTDRTAVSRKLTKLDLPIPSALARITDIDTALGEIRTAAPTDDLRADLLAGKLNDPAKLKGRITKTAQDLAAHDFAVRILADIEHPLDHLARVALHESADEIILSMRPDFERAVAALVTGLDALGSDPRPQLADQSPLLARAYSDWDAALKDARAIGSICNDLDANLEAEWFIDPSVDLGEARAAYAHGEVWGLVVAGTQPLRLNTRGEANALVNAERQARSTQAETTVAQALADQEQYKAKLRAERVGAAT